MPLGVGYNSPEEAQQADMLRAQGVSEDTIRRIFAMSAKDPSALAKQYEAAAWVRRAATNPDFAKTGPGALAQGLAGIIAGKKDQEFTKVMREYNSMSAEARQSWFDDFRRNRARRPPGPMQQGGSVTPVVEDDMPGYQPY